MSNDPSVRSDSSFRHSNLDHSDLIRHSPQRILIIKPSSLGDVATTLPMLCDLRRAYPEAIIDWLIAPAFASLIQNHDALNNLILFERKQLAPWWRSPTAFKKFTALNRRLRSAHYDCVIDAQGLLRSGFFSRITGAQLRIGFADAREGGSLFYTHKIPIRRRDAMSVVRMRALLEPLNIPHDGPAEYRVPLNPQAQTKISTLLPKDPIGFIPGCRGEGKRWPADAFSAVISHLAQHHPIVLFGSPDERELCNQILSQMNNEQSTMKNILNLAGQTTIAEMTAALARCRLIIGNDTGPLHVAVALGKTILGLYGPTDAASVGPYGQLENVIRFHPHLPWQPIADQVITRAESLLSVPAPSQEPACQN
jgi:heptosyltransferase-1